MRLIAVLLLAACGDATPCPSVDKLRGSDDFEKREDAVVVARCRADGWSKEVIDCLVQAPDRDAHGGCFRKLERGQQKKLNDAFEPLEDPPYKAAAFVRAGEILDDVVALRLDELVARAPACADYAAAVKATAYTIARCKDAEREAFGLHQLAERDGNELAAVTEPQQLATECAKRMEQWRNAGSPRCK